MAVVKYKSGGHLHRVVRLVILLLVAGLPGDLE
jgi:hypothetical protein